MACKPVSISRAQSSPCYWSVNSLISCMHGHVCCVTSIPKTVISHQPLSAWRDEDSGRPRKLLLLISKDKAMNCPQANPKIFILNSGKNLCRFCHGQFPALFMRCEDWELAWFDNIVYLGSDIFAHSLHSSIWTQLLRSPTQSIALEPLFLLRLSRTGRVRLARHP